jgi:ectoine hydroxylase-related dioxygenase (phytanoyl-CoA dioxygenase family)
MHLKVDNYWFQQYKRNDYHSWHIHENGLFSCVYYVDMPNEAPKTTFNILGNETEVSVSEGQVLVFPSYLLHCSKPNKNIKTKTIISFNIVSSYE